MRNQLKIVYSALTIVAMLGLTSTVHGVPSFARQTGLDCNSCHASIGYPSLNTFGQAFRAGGYTQASEDTLMGDGEALSIPKTLNLSVISKIRFIGLSETSVDAADPKKTVVTGSNEVNLPDEWAIWLAGRAGKHIGFATEFGAVPDTNSIVHSFKMPIVYDIGPLKAGFVPYWTDAQGPGWGFETLSTGAVGNIRMFETSYNFSARTYLNQTGISGNGTEATGAMFYVWHPMGFVAYSPYAVAVGGGSVPADPHFAHYVRAAVTPSLGGIDIAAGVQWTGGNQGQGSNATPVNYLGFDAQVMGTFGIPMMLALTYGMSDNLKDARGDAQAGNKASVFTALLNVTLIEDLLNIGGGVRFATISMFDNTGKALVFNDGKNDYDAVFTDNAAVAEIKLNIARNMRLSITGLKQLNAVDVVASDNTYKTTTVNAGDVANGSVGLGYNAPKEDKLTVMLFGGF